MAVLPILTAPDPRLKAKSRPVEAVDADLRRLMHDMLATMYDAPGIGLAAPQVGVQKRVIVVDIDHREGNEEEDAHPGNPMMMANPEIVWVADDDSTYEEGCLSVPEQFADVARPAGIRVRYLDQDNQQREMEAEGLLATCIQHEIDHLDGILFIDHLSALKRNMILRKLLKAKRSAEKASA